MFDILKDNNKEARGSSCMSEGEWEEMKSEGTGAQWGDGDSPCFTLWISIRIVNSILNELGRHLT